MKTKVTTASRTTKEHQVVPLEYLPEGTWQGTIGGNIVTFSFEEYEYTLLTEFGVRAPSAPCIIHVSEGGNVEVTV